MGWTVFRLGAVAANQQKLQEVTVHAQEIEIQLISSHKIANCHFFFCCCCFFSVDKDITC